MECTVTGKQMEVTSELRELIHRRLLPLERLLGDAIVSANVVLGSEHQLCVSELVVHARGDHRLHGLAEGPSWPSAVGGAVEKVMRQAHTLKGKWQGRRRESEPPADLVPDIGPNGDGEPRAG